MPHEPRLLTTALFPLLVSHLRRRELEEAATNLNRVEALIAAHPELKSLESDLLFYRAVEAQLSGAWEQARRMQNQLVAIHRASNNFSGLQSALYNSAHVAMFIGQFEEAILYAEELVTYLKANRAEADQYYLQTQRAFLAECYAMIGELAEAERVLVPVVAWLRQEEEGRGAVYSWNALGTVRFYQGRLAEAYYAHSQALLLATRLGRMTSAPYLCHAEVAQLLGYEAEARASFDRATEIIAPQKPTGNSNVTYYHYVGYLLTGEVAMLAAARQAMFSCANLLQDGQLRRTYLARMPLHRDINEAWAKQHSGLVRVQLARAEAPLGRPLRPDEVIEVVWTVDNGRSDAELLKKEGKATLRRHRLQRLVAEAQMQGAAATQEDLAAAVEVSVRTVERDSAALAKLGMLLGTRRKQVD
jgi:tetratricopeptide (TPR) repeat protein